MHVKFYLVVILLAMMNLAYCENPPSYKIEHIEPPFWWEGMKSKKLQLMVHGEGIGKLNPTINAAQISNIEVHRSHSPNYLFIDLEINPKAQPGSFDINFQTLGETVLTQPYKFHKRKRNSAARQGFSSKDAIYLITPDRFANGDAQNDNIKQLTEKIDLSNDSGRHGGDIKGIIDHLDYIQDLGFTMIWSNPLLENNQEEYSYHGYSITDFYNIDARFGSYADYIQLSKKARQKNLGIIQDIILNHIGTGHWWMNDLPDSDWLNYQGKAFTPTHHVRTTIQDPYASSVDAENFTNGWFVSSMPDLNQRNNFVSNYLIQNTIWWIETADLSGLRTDTYSYSDKTFLSEWGRRVMQEYPNFTIVGEEWSDKPATVAYWQVDKVNHDNYVSYIPSLMDFPIYNALRSSLTKSDDNHNAMADLYDTLSYDFLYTHPENLVTFASNHDTSRIFSYLGNDFNLYKMAMTYLLTMRGIPQIFYGEEILMESPKERNDGIVRSNFPGGFKNKSINGFTGLGLAKQQRDAQNFIKKLLNWRKESDVIHTGELTHYVPIDNVYVYFRYNKTKKVMVVLNKNPTEKNLATNRFSQLITEKSQGIDVATGIIYDLTEQVTVPANTSLILEVQSH